MSIPENEAFFRRCWLTLKAAAMTTKKPTLLEQMNRIECAADGVKITKPSPSKKSEDNQNEPETEPVVRI